MLELKQSSITEALILFLRHTSNLRYVKASNLSEQVDNDYMCLGLRNKAKSRYKLRSHWLRDGIWCTEMMNFLGKVSETLGRGGQSGLLSQIIENNYFSLDLETKELKYFVI